LWTGVLVAYVRQQRHAGGDRVITVLMAVLALDAAKNVFENLWFGVLWAANYGLIGDGFRALGHPGPLTAVKLVNVGVATVVLTRLAGRWLPDEFARRAQQRRDQDALQSRLEANLKVVRDDQERLRLAVKATSDIVWDADLRSNSPVQTSAEVPAWLGYTALEWPPDPWYTIVHPDDRPLVLGAVKAVIRGETAAYDVRHRCVRKDGATVHVHSTGVVARDADGRAVRFVGAVRDVTRERLEEAHRLEAQKLEGVGLLASGIAHDFNNLLTVVSASVDTAQHLPDGPERGQALDTAQLAVARAAVLTRQLLAYAGRSAPELRPVDVGGMVADISRLLEVGVRPGVRLDRRLAADLPRIRGHEAQLQQLVMNLVTNAADALGPRGGTVTVTTSRCDTAPSDLTGERPPGGAVRLEVADDGAGMTPEVAAHVFDAFFSTKGRGRGLGLASVVGILRAHGGGIRFHTTPGAGSTFEVYLPVDP
jgi:PAS domain S-box-containing protein